MTAVEVLAPVRLETRFVPPEQRIDGVLQWMLRVRVYPDEFSMRHVVPPPTPAELDRLSEAVASIAADPPIDEAAAFASFASSVGAARALGLWRRCVVPGANGSPSVDRSGQTEPVPLQVHGPVGLPQQIEIWLVLSDGTRNLGATLNLDVAAIGADLDIKAFADSDQLGLGRLPDTWWLSYQRAKDVGLGVDLDVGETPPSLITLVAVGIGEVDASELVDDHNAGGRLAVLAPGTPTNTVEGEPTTDFGENADSVVPMLHVDPGSQQSTAAVLTALTGRVAPNALPMLGGELDYFGPGSLAVQGFWPVLWGRALRDVTTSDGREIDLARWSSRYLAVEGPRPVIRVGAQPYGLLPTSSFASWVADPGDTLASLEDRILQWALPWRAGAAAVAEGTHAWVEGADTEGLLEVIGLHAPSRYWRVRPIADLVTVGVARALAGIPPLPASQWDVDTAVAWREWPYPGFPIATAAHPGQVPGPPRDEVEDAATLKELCFMHPEPLYFQGAPHLGLVGHLFREALISARAIVGEAMSQWDTTERINVVAPLPLDDEDTYRSHVMQGTEEAVTKLETETDDDGRTVASRFREVQEALVVTADLWERQHNALFRGTLAALDSAAFRVDPWLTGIAERRLQAMITDGSPFKLGAYGWVDAPEPFTGAAGGALAPGPTAAGFLHAPSRDQALTSALLRDAAVRHPDDNRWQLTIDSTRVRDAIALAERVRLGVHPYEALGLEVEKVAGDWDVVRILRQNYALLPEQDTRRVCDGAAVLRAARDGTLIAGLPANLAERLQPLDCVLDTYADLLVADGIHALVTGRADLANAAMEAAAGLGAPPDLRSIRTPRAARTVRIAAWVMLPPGDEVELDLKTVPASVADPGFAALVVSQLGAAGLESTDPDVVVARQRLSRVVGGGEDEGPVPSLVGGDHESVPLTGDSDLRAALIADLEARFTRMKQLTQVVHDAAVAIDPDGPGADALIGEFAHRWSIDLSGIVPLDPTIASASAEERRDAVTRTLAERLATAATVVPSGPESPTTDAAVNLRRRAIRALAGDQTLPVLPIVARSLLPTFRPAPDLDQTWLEVVAAVRPRLAPLEARQLDPAVTSWPAVLAAPNGSVDPWHPDGPILAAYGPAVLQLDAGGAVAIAALDGWTDSVPSRRHVTSAAFGFNAPKSRAPHAVLLAVPPDRAQRLTTSALVDVVLETRELAHARATRPTDRDGLPYATPAPLVHAAKPVSFLEGWPK
jgi:hypothetical protein